MLRAQETVPLETVTVAVSLDGVMVPMKDGGRARDSGVLRRITGMIGGRHEGENGLVSHIRAHHPMGIFRIHRCNLGVRKDHGENRAEEKDCFQMHGIVPHGIAGNLQPRSGGGLGAGTSGPEGNGFFLLVRYIC